MIGCLGTHVLKQPIITLYFELETVLKFYNLEASLLVEYGINSRYWDMIYTVSFGTFRHPYRSLKSYEM